MLDPLDFEKRPLVDRLDRVRNVAFLMDVLENLTLWLWRALSWTFFFCGLWLLNIPVMFGAEVPIAVLAIFIIGLFYFLIRDIRYFHWPNAERINQRIEQESGIKHRPIVSLEDKLANVAQPETRALWKSRREALFLILPHLKAGAPRPLIAARDQRALRFAAFMLFVVGLLVAGPVWRERLTAGLIPIHLENGSVIDKSINLRITPPEYTGIGQIILQGSGKGAATLEIPEGSVLKATVFGGLGEPTLKIDDHEWPLVNNGDDNYLLEMIVPKGGTLKIKQLFMTRSAWNFKLIPDEAPLITLKSDVQTQPDCTMRFPLMVYDDYGVKNLTLNMVLDDTVKDASPLGNVVNEMRSILSPSKTEFEINPVYDLTAHPWAGLPVVINLRAEDHNGKSMTLAPIKMVLPERAFKHPVAKALMTVRKKLIWGPKDDYETLSRELESLLPYPGKFQDDIVVFLAIRTAASRLYYSDPSVETAQAIIALLWDTALRIEDGNLTMAARDLRDIQAKLDKALQDPNATNQEIAQLMDELRQAMAQYFTELSREMQKRMENGEQFPILPPEMMSKVISPDALAQFLEQLESQMLSGDKKSAQQMLSQLQRMMDTFDPSMSAPLPPDMQAVKEGINELQQLIDRQEALRDQTEHYVQGIESFKNTPRDFGQQLGNDTDLLHEWGINEMPPAPSVPAQPAPKTETAEHHKTEQEALRYILGQLMLEADQALNQIPENMGLAEREMSGSSTALGANQPQDSIPHQEQAIEHLKQAQQQLSQQFMAKLQQMTGLALSGGSGMKYDPLGRPYGGDGDQTGPFPGSRVRIPEEAERKKAQEILRLLRERSGELNRPPEELDYFRRLLRQF